MGDVRRLVGVVLMIVGGVLALAVAGPLGDSLGAHSWPVVLFAVAAIATGYVAWAGDEPRPFDQERER